MVLWAPPPVSPWRVCVFVWRMHLEAQLVCLVVRTCPPVLVHQTSLLWHLSSCEPQHLWETRLHILPCSSLEQATRWVLRSCHQWDQLYALSASAAIWLLPCFGLRWAPWFWPWTLPSQLPDGAWTYRDVNRQQGKPASMGVGRGGRWERTVGWQRHPPCPLQDDPAGPSEMHLLPPPPSSSSIPASWEQRSFS